MYEWKRTDYKYLSLNQQLTTSFDEKSTIFVRDLHNTNANLLKIEFATITKKRLENFIKMIKSGEFSRKIIMCCAFYFHHWWYIQGTIKRFWSQKNMYEGEHEFNQMTKRKIIIYLHVYFGAWSGDLQIFSRRMCYK